MKSAVEKKVDFDKLFSSQVETLKRVLCPEQIIEMLEHQRERVLKRASLLSLAEDTIPFVPVIPFSFRGVYDLLTMLNVKNRNGIGCLQNPNQIINLMDAPKSLYWLFEVDSGSGYRSLERIKKNGHFPLNIAEVIALCTHSDLLRNGLVTIYALGSRYKDRGGETKLIDLYPNSVDGAALSVRDSISGGTVFTPSCDLRHSFQEEE